MRQILKITEGYVKIKEVMLHYIRGLMDIDVAIPS